MFDGLLHIAASTVLAQGFHVATPRGCIGFFQDLHGGEGRVCTSGAAGGLHAHVPGI